MQLIFSCWKSFCLLVPEAEDDASVSATDERKARFIARRTKPQVAKAKFQLFIVDVLDTNRQVSLHHKTRQVVVGQITVLIGL